MTLIDLLHAHVRRRYRRLGFTSTDQECGRFTVHFSRRTVASGNNTLVLLHGLGTSSSTWIHVLPDLDPTWNVLAIDLPGFGFSTVDNGEPFARLAEHVEAVSSIVETNLARPFLLLGHSLGGWIAARYALEHPSGVFHLILADTAGVLCDDTVELGKAFQIDSTADLRRLLNRVWLHYPWYFRPFYPSIQKDLHRRNVPEFVRSVEEKDFLNSRLGELSGKTSIIWGLQDRLISLQAVDVLKAKVPGLEIHLIDRCGHVPQLECPVEFTRVLRGIMEREGASKKIPLVV